MPSSFYEKKNYRKLGLAILICLLTFPAWMTVSVGSAQTRNDKKPTSTPKKNVSPTPQKPQTKATPTPKKTPNTKTNLKKQDQGSKTSKNTAVTKDKTDGKTPAKKETPTTSKNAKPVSKNEKNALSKGAKTTDKSVNTTQPKTPAMIKNPPQPKTAATTKKATQPKTETKPQASVATKTEWPQVIVSTFSVPVRSQARTSAAIVSRAKLGSVLKVTEKNAAWYKVQSASGGKTSGGWIAANAVSDLGTANRQRLYLQIVEKNYQPEMTFAMASELYEFISKISSELDNSDTSAQIELQRLRSLQIALKNIPVSLKDQSPYRDFLKANEKAIVYSEPAGKFMVASNLFWELHAKYRKSVISDKIAWEAALNPLPGECEGYVNCYLFDMRMRFGEYLNYHPKGEKSLEALTNITNYLEPIVADAKEKAIYNGPTDVTDRAEFNNLIAELRTIITRLPFMEKEKTLRQLKIIAEAYR